MNQNVNQIYYNNQDKFNKHIKAMKKNKKII